MAKRHKANTPAVATHDPGHFHRNGTYVTWNETAIPREHNKPNIGTKQFVELA
jgi:hypothetical protein